MDEENTTQEESKEPVENTTTGIQQEAVSELDRADAIAERQKRENDRRENLLQREEALAARKAVGGVTEAGQPQKVKEESAAEYATKAMAGEL